MLSRWTAILCVQAGAFLQNCIQAIWPSFRNFPNHLPESAGITCRHLQKTRRQLFQLTLFNSCWFTVLLHLLDGPDRFGLHANQKA